MGNDLPPVIQQDIGEEAFVAPDKAALCQRLLELHGRRLQVAVWRCNPFANIPGGV